MIVTTEFDCNYVVAECLKLSTVRMKDLDKLKLVKLAFGGQVLSSSQFLLLHHLPENMTLASKVVKIDSKIIIRLCRSNFVTHSVEM